MRYLAVFFFLCCSAITFAQDNGKISGTVINDQTLLPIQNVNIVNLNKVRGASTNERGVFEIEAEANDTLYVSLLGYASMKVRVSNDWVKNKANKILMTEKAIALEEVIIQPYILTGYLEVDSRLIPMRESHRYAIAGLHDQGYEAGQYQPGAFGKVLGSIFNPADALYNLFGKKPRELKRLKELKRDEKMRGMLESRYDRETIAALLGIDKKDIPEILGRCNYSEAFAQTANDLQILDAISECYEEYKVLKKQK